MTAELSAGAGLCPATFQLSVRPVKAVIELGALGDVIRTALNAAHHANRQGGEADRIAVALPGLHLRRGVARPGQEVVLFGSEAALGCYLTLEGVRTLLRRGMVAGMEIVETFRDPGAPGTAYLRDRAAARRSPGAVRRALARAERRGKRMAQDIETRAPAPDLLVLHYGDAVAHIRELAAPVTEAPLLVSTYGFSSPVAPAVLPIVSDRGTRWTEDAA
jgi:hypothetical protein